VWVDPKQDRAAGGVRLARKLALDEAYLVKRDGGGVSSGGGAAAAAAAGGEDVDGDALDGLLFPEAPPAWGLGGRAAGGRASAGQWGGLGERAAAAAAAHAGLGFSPLDGEPLDGEPLDGEPLDGEPLDGEPLDGEPLVEGFSSSGVGGGGKKRRRADADRSRPSKYAGLGSSRFSDESGSDGGSDDGGGEGGGGDATAGGGWSAVGEGAGGPPGVAMSDEARQLLRAVEVAVLQLRDRLEDEGSCTPREVDQQCAALRATLCGQLPPSS
jgi:hypothetical protein